MDRFPKWPWYDGRRAAPSPEREWARGATGLPQMTVGGLAGSDLPERHLWTGCRQKSETGDFSLMWSVPAVSGVPRE